MNFFTFISVSLRAIDTIAAALFWMNNALMMALLLSGSVSVPYISANAWPVLDPPIAPSWLIAKWRKPGSFSFLASSISLLELPATNRPLMIARFTWVDDSVVYNCDRSAEPP